MLVSVKTITLIIDTISYRLYLCAEVETLIMTLEQGKIRGYQISDPYAEAMLPIAAKGSHCLLQLL